MGTVVNTLLCDESIGSKAAEKAILCVLVKELSEPNDIRLNIFLLLQNKLNVTATALAVQNSRVQPPRVRGYVDTVAPACSDPAFVSLFRMTRQTFQVRVNSIFTFETVLYEKMNSFFSLF